MMCYLQCRNRKTANASQSLVRPSLLIPSNLKPLNKMSRHGKAQLDQLLKTKGIANLDKFSLSRYYQCPPSKAAKMLQDKSSEETCFKQRTFQDKNHSLVALASFQGSGNTWVRHLLEQATGINTGSIYCDTTLKAAFPGEYIVSGSVLVVKTHHADTTSLPVETRGPLKQQKFDKSVIIVRDPFDALVSEANRRWNSKYRAEKHLGLAKESTFISNPKWDWYVEYKGMSWLVFLNTWLKESNIPHVVIQYEKLKENVTQELSKALEFLGHHVEKERMNCVERNSEGLFKRQAHLNFNPFSSENKKSVNRIIEQSRDILKRYNIHYRTR